MSRQPLPALPVIGDLPSGQYTLTAQGDASLREACAATALFPAQALPVFASVATLAADGLSIEELIRLCGAAMEDGPMLGECAMTFHRPLRTGITYRIDRQVRSLERKASRRLGTMDLLHLVVTVTEPGGVPAAEVVYTWVLPK